MAPTDSAGPVGSSTPNTGSNRGDGAGRGRGKGRGKGRGQQAGARGGRSRGRGGGAGAEADAGAAQPAVVDPSAASTLPAPTIPQDAAAAAAAPDDEVEAEVCFICASPVVHQSVAPCNHRTCHICALRMRALYKNKECAHCRTAAAYVIFTDDATKRFEDYSVGAPDISSSDENIGIRYAKEDIVGDTVLLLRYNCPDNDCDFAGLSWPDLHRHVRNVHHKKMCDLCTRSKKVFTHEHELFTDKELERHMRHGDDRPGAADQTGFKGHPLCAFCGSRFYDGDKLYEHCRNKHERCFLCDREDPRQPHYYLDYNALEQHFSKDHYLCPDRECQEKKFVVFASELDLKAHQLSEHGSTLSKDVRRDARLVDMAGFDFRQPYQGDQRGGRERNGGRDRNGEREREGRGRRGRDPNAEPIPASSAQPLRRDELAFQRQMAIHSSQSVSNRTFGGQLSSTPARPTAAAPPAATNRSNANASSSTAAASTASPATGTDGRELTDPNLTTEERARLVRHASVIERASNLLQNDANKMATFRSQISAYRNDQVAPPALIESFFALFAETSSTALGTLIREVADLFEDKTKAERLRNAWNDWRAINEDYPTLPGLSGMRGAATSRGGWASATANSPAASTAPAQRQSTRVLKLKNSTQQSQRSSAQSSSWASSAGSQRSLPSATSFPALPSASGTSTPTGRASTPSSVQWTTAGGAKSQPGPSRPPTAPKSGPRPTGADNFPALPSAPKPTTTIFGYGRGAVRRDMGGSKNTGFSWGASADAESSAAGAAQEGGEEGEGKGKKKGNKGRKQVLVQWG